MARFGQAGVTSPNQYATQDAALSARFREQSQAMAAQKQLAEEAQRLGRWEEAPALLASLDALRTAITIFDSHGRLLYANAHLNYLLRSLPPHEQLIGRSYEELIRLEIAGGEIAPMALNGGISAFIAQRVAQLGERAFAPLDVLLADHRVVEIKARRSPA